jgi:phosphoribosylanthranilate isomerase
VSSGVELAPGEKDPAAVRSFIRAVHLARSRTDS